jgi:homoserine O-acetyltransferase
MFFPVRDCETEQKLVSYSELRVVESDGGHLALFGFDPAYVEQVDRHLVELLDTSV